MDAIPLGSPGTSEYRIRSTSDVPSMGDGTGTFRTVCDYTHMNFDDPIVFPGEPGRSHLHAYFGNTIVDASSTAESLATTGNSACRGGIANRTAYWVPATIDADGVPMRPIRMIIYYKSGYFGVLPEDVEVFPQGLRMIAGTRATDPEPSPFINYTCVSRGYDPRRTFPSCPAGDVLVMTVRFPQCWNGMDLDAPDHRSHMAYANGGCPPTHPVPLPEVTYNVEYAVPAGGTTGWFLSSDEVGGLPGASLHADWFAAWDPAIAEEFVESCINEAVDCHAHLLGPFREIYY